MSFDRTEAKVIRDALLAIVRVLEKRYHLNRAAATDREMVYDDPTTEVATLKSR